MIRGMVLGHYMPLQSPVHNLDPRTKIAVAVLFTVSVFLVADVVGYGVLLALLGLGVALSHTKASTFLRALKPLVWVMAISFLLNAFLTEGRPLLVLGTLRVTHEGLRSGLEMLARLSLLLGASSLLTLTTSPIEITDGLEALLRPFRRLGVPAHELAVMMSIALRFIPTLGEEAEKIASAQISRGADFGTGGLMRRSRSLVSLLVPLFVSSFRRADELAMAMEARLYRGGVGRTRLRQLRFRRADVVAAAVVVPSIIFGTVFH